MKAFNHPRPNSALRTDWTLGDLIDLELLLDGDRKADPEEVTQRNDRIRGELADSLSKEHLAELEVDTPVNRRWWLHQWLKRRLRSESTTGESVGDVLMSVMTTVGTGLALLGAGLGLSSLLGLLAAPTVIDVPVAILVYLGPQLVLLALLIWGLMLQNFGWASPSPPLLLNILSRLVGRLFKSLLPRVEDAVRSDETLARYEAGVNLIIGRSKLRSEALEWPLIQLAQRAGASFAGAIAVGMFVMCVFSHFNFGWGSTSPQIDGKRIYSTVRVIALPWSWLLRERVGYPSLEQVEKSRTFRDQHQLPDGFPRLSSWWIFLCLTLFTYAFVPRVLLLWYSVWKGRQALANEAFRDRRCDALFRSLAKPRLQRTVSEKGPAPVGGAVAMPDPSTDTEAVTPNQIPPAHCEVLTEQELTGAQKQAIASRIGHLLALNVSSFQYVYSSSERRQSLARLADLDWADGTPRVLFLYRADDPVVAGLRTFVEQCLDLIGVQGHLLFGLIGRVDDLDELIDPEDTAAWSEYADRLKRKNPNVEVEILSGKAT